MNWIDRLFIVAFIQRLVVYIRFPDMTTIESWAFITLTSLIYFAVWQVVVNYNKIA